MTTGTYKANHQVHQHAGGEKFKRKKTVKKIKKKGDDDDDKPIKKKNTRKKSQDLGALTQVDKQQIKEAY